MATIDSGPLTQVQSTQEFKAMVGSTEDSGKSQRKPSPADFMFGTTLGEGAYARVVHARMKNTGDEFAVKIMEKRFIKKENKVKFVMMERQVFSKLSNERVVKLYFTFQDRSYLYMVMELCKGGELLDVINSKLSSSGNRDVACSEEITRFYISEIIQALEYLHSNGIIHRDLKPENILLTEAGHIKITDFGTAKDESSEGGRSNTFCGTAEYVSPEVLRDQEASRGCDLWAVGCMIYQMFVGRPLFRAENEYLTFQQILNHPADDFVYPSTMPLEAIDLCTKLLVQDPSQRLGSGSDSDGNGYLSLKEHPFFTGIQWDILSQTRPPYQPKKDILPPTDNDGATEDWLFAGVATELQVSTLSPHTILHEQVNSSTNNMPPPTPTRTSAKTGGSTNPKNRPTPKSSTYLWNRFLMDDEGVVISGLISKRKGLFSKKRQLLLTTTPRLIYIDPLRMKQKGEIPWTEHLYVQIKNSGAFDIVTPNRTYHISDPSHNAQKWADAISHSMMKQNH